ncbi:MAG: LysR family transcriptional regulator [Pseudomonadota bacterium]
MDRLDELRLFIAVLDTGSLATAARKLRRSPPAVTRALAELEARLGVRLIERTTRRLAPTEAGRRLAEQARRLLADFEEAMGEAAGESTRPRGRLRIAAPLAFGRIHVAPIVTAFLDAYPEVSAELSLADRVVDLVEEEIDVAVRISRLGDTSLVARRVGAVRRVLAASPAYLAEHGTPESPADLRAHELILFSGSGEGEWKFADPQGREGEISLPVRARFAVNQADAAIAAAREGRGIVAALSYQVAPDLKAGQLVRVLQDFETAPIPVQLVFPSARHMVPRLRAFLDFAAPRLAALDVLCEDCGQN